MQSVHNSLTLYVRPRTNQIKRRKGVSGAKMPRTAVTVERLERALAIAAYIVVLDGPVAAPIFDRLERELQNARASQDSVARARQLLEGYTNRNPGAGGLKAIG
jgi:hypothetical protein